MLQNREKYIGMIDEVLEEPNNLSKDWLELLSEMRELLRLAPAGRVGETLYIAAGGRVIESQVCRICFDRDGWKGVLSFNCETGCRDQCCECGVYEWYGAHEGDWSGEMGISEVTYTDEDLGVSVFARKENAERAAEKQKEKEKDNAEM